MIYMNCSRNFKLVLILSSVALCLNTVQAFFLSSSDVYAQENVNPLVYHLSSDEPWRATVAISDATTLLKLGHNVTLLLSVEGVQIGVKNPHHYLGLNSLTGNVTDFISEGGNVIICEVCLKIAGYNNSDIIEGALIGNPEIMSRLLSNATVIDY